jgi:energy-coupling factor transporter transmembrane protein EcfT
MSASGSPGDVTAETRDQRRWRQHDRHELHLFRLLPGDSAVHRLWAGTKLVCLAIVSLAASLHPTWPTLTIVATIIAAGVLLGRIPPGAMPRLPRWFLVGVLLSGALSVWSTTPPTIRVHGIVLSIGGLEDWARFLLLAIVLVTGAALIGWTTPTGEFAPALARLTRPFQRLPLPIETWIIAVALSVRCFPLLVDEIQTLLAVRRLRAQDHARSQLRSRLQGTVRSAIDLLVAALVASVRRAHDMSDAIEARGGLGEFADSEQKPTAIDWTVMLVVTAVTFAAFAIG